MRPIQVIGFLICFTASLIFVSDVVAEINVSLCSDPWPPYVEGEYGEDAAGGLVVEVLKVAFARIGQAQPAFPIYNWARCLENIKDGLESGVIVAQASQERREYMKFSEVLFFSDDKIWYSPAHHPDGIQWDTIDDLAKYKIGITRGYSMGPAFDEARRLGKLQVYEVREDAQNLEKITLGRIDIVIMADLIGQELVNKNGLKGAIIPAKKSYNMVPFKMAFSKKSKAFKLLPKLNEVIKEMHEDGTIKRIFSEAQPGSEY